MLDNFCITVLYLFEEVERLIIKGLQLRNVLNDKLNRESLLIVIANPVVKPVAMEQENLKFLIEVLNLLLRATSNMNLFERLVLDFTLFVRHHKFKLVSLLMIIVTSVVLKFIGGI